MKKKSLLIFNQPDPSKLADVIEYKNNVAARAVVSKLTATSTFIEAKSAFDDESVVYGVYTRPKQRPRT